jgi:hypothetical protein
MKKTQYIFYILCLIATLSCATDEQCRTNRIVTLELGLYHVATTDTTRISSAASIDSLTVKGLIQDTLTGKYTYSDSILYNNSKKVSKIYLPLNKFKTSTSFELTFDTTKDTLTILHQNINDYLSLDCGCIKIHSIDTAFITNKHFVDSIRIINHTVNNVNAEHIQIYK